VFKRKWLLKIKRFWKKLKKTNYQKHLFNSLFNLNTPEGKCCNHILNTIILLSLIILILESLITSQRSNWLNILEWWITVTFTLEYILRIIAMRKKKTYTISFFGFIDLITLIPTYLLFLAPLIISGSMIKFLKILRIFKLVRYYEMALFQQIKKF
jgi:voltage-gated potassium channel